MNNPIHKALSVMQAGQVQCLLMGGQACIVYGGAEFSRDVDFAVLASPENLSRLRQALAGLSARVIAVPPLEERYLRRGHAVHFRCAHSEARDLRMDIMATGRGLDPFERLWERRTSLELEPGLTVDLLALPDLVKAKKTQQDKDWPMIRRLFEADVARAPREPAEESIRFWLREGRTPSLLQELATQHRDLWEQEQAGRPVLAEVSAGNERGLERALLAEEQQEREADRQYWLPLRRELERLRHERAPGP